MTHAVIIHNYNVTINQRRSLKFYLIYLLDNPGLFYSAVLIDRSALASFRTYYFQMQPILLFVFIAVSMPVTYSFSLWIHSPPCCVLKKGIRLCILIVVYVFLLFVHVFLTLSMYSYCCLCILIVIYVFLLFVHVFFTLSMHSYCCLYILIVRPCILNVVYVFLLLSMYSYCSSMYS